MKKSYLRGCLTYARSLVAGILVCGGMAARADYYDFRTTEAQAGWQTLAGSGGSWLASASFGWRATNGVGRLVSTNSYMLAADTVISLNMSKASSAGAPAVTLSYYAESDASGTALASETFTNITLYVSPAFTPAVTHRVPAELAGRTAYVTVSVSGLTGGNTLNLLSLFIGRGLKYQTLWPCSGTNDIGAGGWYSSGVPWEAVNEGGTTGPCYRLDVRNTSSMTTLRTRYQLDPPQNDNVRVSFEIFNEPDSTPLKKDYFQVYAHTNAWINEAPTRIAVEGPLPRWDANAPEGSNAWRRVSVSTYIPGIRNTRTFQLGFEGQGSAGGRYLRFRNITVDFRTTVEPMGIVWKDAAGVTIGHSESNDLRIGATPIPAFHVELRPDDDAAVDRVTVYRRALNRGGAETARLADTVVSNGIGRVFWTVGNAIDAVEAGETNLVRAECYFSSKSGLATNSPSIYPKSGDWITNVVGGVGGVWINEIGTNWVELASRSGRVIPDGWKVAYLPEGASVYTEHALSGHTFTANIFHDLSFLAVAPVADLGTRGNVKLLNSVGVVEFEGVYDLSSGSWGARGSCPNLGSASDWTFYWTNFVYGVTNVATEGEINAGQYKTTDVQLALRAQASVVGYETVIPNVKMTVTPLFSNQATVSPTSGITRATGWTDVMTFRGEHISSETSKVQIASSVFGYLADDYIADAAVSRQADPVITNDFSIPFAPSLAYDPFDTLATYWGITQLTAIAVDWIHESGRVYAKTRNLAAGKASVFSVGNALLTRGKSQIRVSLDVANNYSGGKADYGVPLFANSNRWTDTMQSGLPVFSNRFPWLDAIIGNTVNSSVPYTAIVRPASLDMAAPVYFGIRATSGGTARDLYLDNVTVAFQDALNGKSLALRQYAADITKPVTFDLHAEVEVWGTNVTRVVPSLVWRMSGEPSWTTTRLIPHLDWQQVSGAMAGTDGTGVITLTNNTVLVATNLPIVNLTKQDRMEYYLMLAYNPDDTDPARYAEPWLNEDGSGSLKRPEVRYYPDNHDQIGGAWTCIGKTYGFIPLTNTVGGLSDVWINEVSRNTNGAPSNAFIELVGPTNKLLSGWTVEVSEVSATPAKLLATYALTNSLLAGATNGYAFYVIGGAGVIPTNVVSQALTNDLPEQCGVTLKDKQGNIRYRLAFTSGSVPAGWNDVFATNRLAHGFASWSACGVGNPGNQQYAWTGSAIRTPGAPNSTEPTQIIENGGPIGTGVTGLIAVSGSTDRIAVTVSGAADADGVSTGVVIVVQGAVEVARIGFPGTDLAMFTVSNLSENVRYEAHVVYTDAKGVARDGVTGASCYTLLADPAAPTLADRTTDSIAVATAMPHLTNQLAGAFFTGPNGNSGWQQLSQWQDTGLTPNTQYGYSVLGRNGDGIETEASPVTNYYTLANPPWLSQGALVSVNPMSPSLGLSVTNLTGVGGDAAFGNPNYTCYMLLHSNVMGGAVGYVTTNGMAAVNAAQASSLKNDATWLPITAWTNLAIFCDAGTYDLRLVARNQDGVETAEGKASRGIVTLQLALDTAQQVADQPWRLSFSGRFMNPTVTNLTDLALEYSTNSGASFASAFIRAGTVTVGTGPVPAVNNGQYYPILDAATENYTNTLTAAEWGVTNNLAWGKDYLVTLRLAGNDAFLSEASPATNLFIDLSAPDVAFSNTPALYTKTNSCEIFVVTPGAAQPDDIVTEYRLKWEFSPDYGTNGVWYAQTDYNWTAPSNVAAPFSKTGLSAGAHRISVIGRDAAGNWQTTPNASVLTWNVDAAPPTTVTADFANKPLPTDLNTYAITFVMVTNTPLNAVRWDYVVTNSVGETNANVVNCPTNRFTVTVPVDDTYGIRVWATDQAGNRQSVSQPTRHEWEVDLTAPPLTGIVVSGIPQPITSVLSAAVTVTNAPGVIRHDSFAQWACVLNGAKVRPAVAVAAGAVSNLTGFIQNATNTLYIWARDPAGNWSADSDAFVTNWYVDTTVPVAWFNPGVPAYIKSRTASVTMGSAGPLDAVQWRYRLAGQSEIAWTSVSTQTVTVAADGTYTNLVWARDAAGNEQAAPSTNIWRADTTAPTTLEFRIIPVPLISEWTRVQPTNFAFRVEVDLPALFGGGSDSNALFRYRLNGGATSNLTWSSSTGTVVTAAGGDVTNRLDVWAYDWLTNGPSTANSFYWIVDTVAPVARMTVTPQSQGVQFQTNTTWTVRVTNDEQVVAYRYTLNDGTRPAGGDRATNQSFSVSGLANGSTNTVRVWGCDEAGNWQVNAEADAYTRIVDTSAPSAVLWGYPPAYTTQTVIRVGVTNAPGLPLQDTVERYRWQLVGPTPVAPTEVGSLADIVTPTLSEGAYTNLVWGYDPAGNRQVASTNVSWTVDTTAPTPLTADFANRPLPTDLNTNVLTFVMVTNTPLNAVRWDYTVTNSLGTAVVSVVNCTSNRFTVTLPSADTYGIRVWATDQAGNRQAVGQPTAHTWEVDFSAPPVLLFGVPAPYTQSVSASIYATNAVNALRRDQLAQWVGVLDGGASPVRPSFSLAVGAVTNFTGLADGTHTLHAWACDRSGNWTTNGAAYVTNWVVDTVAPEALFAVPVPAYTNSRTARIIMGSTGRVDAVQWRYRLAGQSEIAWTAVATQTVTVAADGTYTNLVWARDAAGNEQAAPSTNIWRADTTAPTTLEFRIIPVPLISEWTRVQPTNFAFRVEVDLPALFGGGSDSNALFRYRLNGGATSNLTWSSSTGTVVTAAGGDVTNRLDVWAYDWLTNGPSTANSFYWIVDTVAPVARMTVTPQSQGVQFQTNTAWTVRVTNDEQVVAYRYTLNDGTRPAGGDLTTNQSFSVSGLANGSTNTLRVWGRDEAGNWQVNAEADAYTRIVDTSAPVAVLWGYPPAYTNQTVVRVGVTNAPGLPLQDTVVRYRWQLVGPTPVAPTEVGSLADIVTPTLSEGAYTNLVWGYDPAGNRQVIPTAAYWTVDTTAPTTLTADFANRPLPTDINTNVLTFVMVTNTPLNAVRWDYTVTNSLGAAVVSVVNCTSNRFTVTVPAEDTYGIRVWATDQAGNRQAAGLPTVHTWEADISAPPVLLFGVPAPYTQSTNASVYATNAVNALRRDQLTQWVGVLDGGASPVRPAFSLTVGAVTNFTGLADGTHTLHAWACDRSGNWTTNGAAYVTNWVVDTVAPEALFAVPVPAYTNSRTARIIMGSTGRVDAVQWRYRLAGQSEIAWTAVATQTVTVAADGTYTNLVWARDAAGNEQGAPTTNVWRSDTTAPLANEFRVIPEPLFPQWKRFKATNFLFRVEVDLPALFSGGSDSNATYRYQFKTGQRTDPVSAVQPVATKFTVVSAEGDDVTNTVTVWTSDWLGNGLSVSNTFTWIVDTIEPVAAFRIDPAATDATWQTNRTWTGTVTGDTQTVSYQWTLDGGAATNVVASTNVTFTTPLLPEGWHTVSVWGRDIADNWQTDPTEYTRFVDVTPPVAVLVGYPVPYTTQTWARVSVTNAPGALAQDTVTRYRWQLALNGVPLSGVSGDVSVPTDIAVTNLADGAYTLSVWGRDPAGNLATVATPVQWTVDTLAPSAAFTTPPPKDINTNVIVFVMATNPPLGAVSWRFAVTNALGGPVTNAVTRDNRITITLPTDGIYGIWLKASDEAGNEQSDVLAWAWEVDRVAIAAAGVRLSGVPPFYTNALSALISVTNVMGAARKDTVVEWSLALNGVAPSRPVFSLPGGAVTNVTGFIPDATNTLYVWVCDFAGNWSPSAVTTNWFEDKTPPVAVFVQKPARRVNSPTNMFEMAASGPLGAERWTYVVTNAVGTQVAGGSSANPTFFFILPGADGAYTIYVTAYDRAGNASVAAPYSWTLDRVAPTATYDVTPVANGPWQTNLLWTARVTGDPDVVAYRWTLDNPVRPSTGETSTNTPTFFTNTVSQGVHALYVWGRDEAGNWQTGGTAYVRTNDTIAPVAVLQRMPVPENGRTNATAWVFFVGGADVVAYRWTLDDSAMPGEGETLVAQGFSVSNLTEGVHIVRAWGRDAAGNWQTAAPAAYTWTVDTTPPEAVLILNPIQPVGGRTNATAWVFMIGGTDVDAYRWTLNDPAMPSTVETPVATPLPVGPLAEGTYVLRVWGRDVAGNWLSVPATNTWTVDTTPPVARFAVEPPKNGIWQTNNVWTVTVTGDTQVVAYTWAVDRRAPSPETVITDEASRTFQTPALGEGVRVLQVWGRDVAGNRQTVILPQDEYTATVDTLPPAALLQNVPAEYMRADAISVGVTNAAGAADYNTVTAYRWQLALEGAPLADWSDAAAVSAALEAALASDGEYTLSVIGQDPAGNWQLVPGTVTNWVRDTVAPTAWFLTPIPDFTNRLAVSFTLGSSNRLDSVAWTYHVLDVTNATAEWSTNATHWVTVPDTGTYTNLVWGRDAAGNVQDQPTTNIWMVDVTPPSHDEIHVVPSYNGVRTNLLDYSFAVSVDLPSEQGGGTDTNAFYQWSFNGSPRSESVPVGAPLQLTSAAGPNVVNTLTVWASDASLNWQEIGLIQSWVVDTEPPLAAFDPMPPALIASRTNVFTMVTNGTDAVVWTYRVTGPGGFDLTVESPSNTLHVIVPQDGEYALTVVARDAAGNSSTALPWNWTVDTVPPAVVAILNTPVPVGGRTNVTAWTFGVGPTNDVYAYRWTLDAEAMPAAGETAVATGFSVTNLTDAAHTVRVWGRDEAGNWQTDAAVYTWTVDTVPPVASYSVTPPASDATWQMSAVWTVSVDGDAQVVAFRWTWDDPLMPTAGETPAGTEAVTATLPEGSHTLRVWGRDEAGNWQADAELTRYTRTVDTRPPAAVSIVNTPLPEGGRTNVTHWTFRVSGAEVYAYRWTLDQPAMPTAGDTPVATGFSVTNLADGSHTVRAWGRDVAGNWLLEPDSYTWTVDTVAPRAQFERVPLPLVNTNTVSFTVSNDLDSVAWYVAVTNVARNTQVTNAWIYPASRSFEVKILPADGQGIYAISLFGKDEAGNLQTMPVVPGGVFVWELDTTSPTNGARFASELMPRDPTNRTDVVAWLQANADIAEWRVSLDKQSADGSTWTPVVANVSVTNQAGRITPTEALVHTGATEGTYRLRAVARDAANNWQTEPVTNGVWVWEIDLTPPVAIFEVVPSPVTHVTQERRSLFVASNVVENIVLWKYKVTRSSKEGVADTPAVTVQEWTNTVSRFYVEVEFEGTYSIELLGCDAAGNWQTESVAGGRYSWSVEEASYLVASAYRNTVVTNGNLAVEVVINLISTNGNFWLGLGETLPSSAIITGAQAQPVNMIDQTPVSGVETQLVTWLLGPTPGARTVTLRYTVPGLTSRENLDGILSWYEVTAKSKRMRTMWVYPNSHTVAMSAYELWAAEMGLDPASPLSAPLADADEDGVCNRDEYWADTDPTVKGSLFRMTAIDLMPGNVLWLQVSAGPNATLVFGWKAALSQPAWTPITPLSIDKGAGAWTVGFPVPQTNGVPVGGAFFRAEALERP